MRHSYEAALAHVAFAIAAARVAAAALWDAYIDPLLLRYGVAHTCPLPLARADPSQLQMLLEA